MLDLACGFHWDLELCFETGTKFIPPLCIRSDLSPYGSIYRRGDMLRWLFVFIFLGGTNDYTNVQALKFYNYILGYLYIHMPRT
jgi:hypothetical protein